MKVELIDYNPDALALLIFTKQTRLQGVQSIEDVKAWPMEKQLEELAYMRDTIKSSWEFSNYAFNITGVTRAFTHQLVRTRQASYAQESMRSIDASDHEWLNTVKGDMFEGDFESNMFDASCQGSINQYSNMLNRGVPPQDARGVLPTNILTSIIMGANLRTLHEMGNIRLCTRTQGEYQNVFKAMKAAVVAVHPWADDFIQVYCVNTGTCCFPRYDKCPIKEVLEPNEVVDAHKAAAKTKWENTIHEAIAIAKDGKTM